MYTLLNNRSIVKVEGEDRFKFLQGLISNDVNKLKSMDAIYACMLTAQGKYFADLFLTEKNESILIDVPASREEGIIKKLNMYKLRSAVSISKCIEYQAVAFIEKPNISNIYNIIFMDPRSSKLGMRGFIAKAKLAEDLKDLEESPDAYDLARIENFIAEGEKDLVSEQSFILEYGLDDLNAIDYNKGCYVGQELVARTHYRGIIRKQILQVSSDKKLPELGSLIYAGEQKLGLICSSIDNRGLAVIRVENLKNLDKDAVITANGQEVKLRFKEKAGE